MVDDKKRIVNQANVYEGLKDRSFMEAQFTVYAPTNILFKKKKLLKTRKECIFSQTHQTHWNVFHNGLFMFVNMVIKGWLWSALSVSSNDNE